MSPLWNFKKIEKLLIHGNNLDLKEPYPNSETNLTTEIEQSLDKQSEKLYGLFLLYV